MPKIVAVVGGKHSGKTTVIENLICEFKRRGFRVGTVKEMVRVPALDTPETETDRYAAAGAETIVAIPREETVVFIKKRLTVKEALGFVGDLDFVFLEGFETEDAYPRIIAAKTAEEAKSFMTSKVLAISGLISESTQETKKATELQAPVLNSIKQTKELADLIMTTLK